jgi:hypothetical protein
VADTGTTTRTAEQEGVVRAAPARPLTAEKLRMRAVFRHLKRHPADRASMYAYSDALEECGHGVLAAAYRWAADNGKWPFRRYGRGVRGTMYGDDDTRRLVYDWNKSITNGPDPNLPESCQLSLNLVLAVWDDKDRCYGGVHRAFVILANALVRKGWIRVQETG